MRISLKASSVIFALMLLSASLALAACTPAAALEPTAAATLTPTTASTSTLAPTAKPFPTATPEPTQTPSFEGIELPQGTGRLYEVEGRWFYDSPARVLAGKEVAMVVNHHVNPDGSLSIWMAPEAYPNAPLFVKDENSAEWRRGPFGYEDVKRRYTFPTEGIRNEAAIVLPYEGSVAPLGLIDIQSSSGGDSYIYLLSGIPVGDFIETDGVLRLPMAAPVMNNEDGFMYYFDWVLGNVNSLPAVDPWYAIRNSALTYNQSDNLAYIISSGGTNFYKHFAPGFQIVFLGVMNIEEGTNISQSAFPGNFALASEYDEQIKEFVGILQTGEYQAIHSLPQAGVLSGVISIMLRR